MEPKNLDANRTPRIERTDPKFLADERVRPRRYGRSASIPFKGARLDLAYRLTRWGHNYSEEITERALFCWVKSGAEILGAVEFREYKIPDHLDEEDILFEFDAIGQYEESLANAFLITAEAIGSPFWLAGETLLDFRMAWAAQGAPAAAWAVAARFLSTKCFQHHGLMMLKAFPLEYEGRLEEHYATAFAKRQSAMVRYYARHLGVQRAPDQAGDHGWMFRRPEYQLSK